jgi:hypothetical protein
VREVVQAGVWGSEGEGGVGGGHALWGGGREVVEAVEEGGRDVQRGGGGGSEAEGGGGVSHALGGGPGDSDGHSRLLVLVIDGSWQQAKSLNKRLPASWQRICLDKQQVCLS